MTLVSLCYRESSEIKIAPKHYLEKFSFSLYFVSEIIQCISWYVNVPIGPPVCAACQIFLSAMLRDLGLMMSLLYCSVFYLLEVLIYSKEVKLCLH